MADIGKLPWETDEEYEKRVAELHANMPIDRPALLEQQRAGLRKTLVDESGKDLSGATPTPMKGADVGLRITRPDGQSKVTSYENYADMQAKFGNKPGYKLDTVQIYAVEKNGQTKLIEEQHLDRAIKAGARVVPRDQYKTGQRSKQLTEAIIRDDQGRPTEAQPVLADELAKDVKSGSQGVFPAADEWRDKQMSKIAQEESDTGAAGIYLGHAADTATFGLVGRSAYRQLPSFEEYMKGDFGNLPPPPEYGKGLSWDQLGNDAAMKARWLAMPPEQREAAYRKFVGDPSEIARGNQERAEQAWRDAERTRLHKIAAGTGDITGMAIGMGPFKGLGGVAARGVESALAKRGILSLEKEYAKKLAGEAITQVGVKEARNALLAKALPIAAGGATTVGAYQAANELPRLSDQKFGFDAIMESAGNVMFAAALGAIPIMSTRVKSPVAALGSKAVPIGTAIRDINTYESTIAKTLKEDRAQIAKYNPELAAADAQISSLKRSLEEMRQGATPEEEALVKSLAIDPGDISKISNPMREGWKVGNREVPPLVEQVAPTLRTKSGPEIAEAASIGPVRTKALNDLMPRAAHAEDLMSAEAQITRRQYPDAPYAGSKGEASKEFTQEAKSARNMAREHIAKMDADMPGIELEHGIVATNPDVKTVPGGGKGQKAVGELAPGEAPTPRAVQEASERLSRPASPEVQEAWDKLYAPQGDGTKGGFYTDRSQRVLKKTPLGKEQIDIRARDKRDPVREKYPKSKGEEIRPGIKVAQNEFGYWGIDDYIDQMFASGSKEAIETAANRGSAEMSMPDRAEALTKGLPGKVHVWKNIVRSHFKERMNDRAILAAASEPLLTAIEKVLIKAGSHKAKSIDELLALGDEAASNLAAAGETAAAEMLSGRVNAARVLDARMKSIGRSRWITDEPGELPRAEAPEGRYTGPAWQPQTVSKTNLDPGYLPGKEQLAGLEKRLPFVERAATEAHMQSPALDTGPRQVQSALDPWQPFDSRYGADRPATLYGEPQTAPAGGPLVPGAPKRTIHAGENRGLGSKLWGEIRHAGEGIGRTVGRAGARQVGRTIADKALGGLASYASGGGLSGMLSRWAINRIGGHAFGKAFDHTMDAAGAAQRWQETTKQRINGAVSGKPAKTASSVPPYASKTKRTLVAAVNEAVMGKASDSDRLPDVVKAKIDQVQKAAANMDAIKEHLWEQFAPMRSVDQPMSEKLLEHIQKTIQFLNTKMPKDPDAGKFGPKQTYWRPNEEQSGSAARYIVAAANPVKAFLDELDHGEVSPETMETLQALQPEAFQWIQGQVMEAVANAGGDLPHAKRLALSRALAINLEPTDEPEFTYGIGQFFAENAAEGAKQPGASRGTIKTAGGLATSTRSQRYMG